LPFVTVVQTADFGSHHDAAGRLDGAFRRSILAEREVRPRPLVVYKLPSSTDHDDATAQRPHLDRRARTRAAGEPASSWVAQSTASLDRYSLVVVGAGAAGLVTAHAAAALGAKVALIERDLLGGDCLNVGCVPLCFGEQQLGNR